MTDGVTTEYTPTMEQLQTRLGEYAFILNGIPRSVTDAEFARALVAHDREVAVKTLRDFTARVRQELAETMAAYPKWADANYLGGMRSALLQADAEADRIEKGNADVE